MWVKERRQKGEAALRDMRSDQFGGLVGSGIGCKCGRVPMQRMR